LGLQPQASEQEVKEARNFVTQAFHPDKYPLGSKDQERANQKQIEINEAYQKINEHFERLKREQALMQAPMAAGDGPGQVHSASEAARAKTPVIVIVAKVLLVGLLAGAWGCAIWGWVSSAHTPAAQSSPIPQMATQNALPGSASQSSSVTQAQPSSPPSRQNPDVHVTDSSASSGMPEVSILDVLILLSLVLSTLAVVWFLFAPESRALIERLVGTQK
jgi:hypothetical protein